MVRLLAPNPGPMTLDGTNTWLLHPEDGPAMVVDPGPDEAAHLDAIAAACPAGVETILLTHHHADHVAGVGGLVSRTGAAVRALRPDLCHSLAGPGDPGTRTPVRTSDPESPLTDGERLERPGLVVEVLHVPGHTSDSVALLVTVQGVTRLLTGDTVLGRGTSVIAHPDGNLADYLESLRRLARVVEERGVVELLPGHGPVLDRPAEVLASYQEHRRQRLHQVRAARAAGAENPDDVVRQVYGELEPELHQAALRSVRAQLDHLAASAG